MHGQNTLEVDVNQDAWLLPTLSLANAKIVSNLLRTIREGQKPDLDAIAAFESARILWAQPWLIVLQAYAYIIRKHNVFVDSDNGTSKLRTLLTSKDAGVRGIKAVFLQAIIVLVHAQLIAQVYTENRL